MTGPSSSGGILQHSKWDLVPVFLAAAHGAVLASLPPFWVVALGLWWNANSISHNFIHLPYFRSPVLNAVFSWYLSLVLGVPQSLWRDRHLAHHAGAAPALRPYPQLLVEIVSLAALWGVLIMKWPMFFLTAYLPGYLAGLVLCQLQGRYEHIRGAISHAGFLYNFLFLNDGYHVEHHENQSEHWTRLPERRKAGTAMSRWPAVLRWLEALNLETLERAVLRSPRLQSFVLRCHEAAFRKILRHLPEVRVIEIIGGGLFPRTALVLRRLLPTSHLTVIDANSANLASARAFTGDMIEMVHRFYEAGRTSADLLIIPLSYRGDRARIYQDPPARAVIVHDWVWNRRGRGAIVSLLLLKRLNLVTAPAADTVWHPSAVLENLGSTRLRV